MRKERRRAALKRRTRGTEVEIDLRLDGSGRSSIETPFAPLNHLLELLAGHGGLDLKLIQTINRHADDAYAIDDLATAVAEAFRRAVGERPRIRQFGSEILPVGDVLVLTAVDLVSPALFQFGVSFRTRRFDGMDVALIERFLATLTDRLGACLHVRMLAGNHDENKWRAIFLAIGRSLALAATEVEREGAREIAADIDYVEGVPHRQAPLRPGETEEAIVEEIEAGGPAAYPETEIMGEVEPLRPRRGRGVERRGEIAAHGRDEGPSFRDQDEARPLPELPDVPELPDLPELPEFPDLRSLSEGSDLEELPHFTDLEAGSSESEGVEGEGGPVSGEARRRRRGRRGGRGRRRTGERPEMLAAPRAEGPEAGEEVDAGNGRGELRGPGEEPRRGPGRSIPRVPGWRGREQSERGWAGRRRQEVGARGDEVSGPPDEPQEGSEPREESRGRDSLEGGMERRRREGPRPSRTGRRDRVAHRDQGERQDRSGRRGRSGQEEFEPREPFDRPEPAERSEPFDRPQPFERPLPFGHRDEMERDEFARPGAMEAPASEDVSSIERQPASDERAQPSVQRFGRGRRGRSGRGGEDAPPSKPEPEATAVDERPASDEWQAKKGDEERPVLDFIGRAPAPRQAAKQRRRRR